MDDNDGSGGQLGEVAALAQSGGDGGHGKQKHGQNQYIGWPCGIEDLGADGGQPGKQACEKEVKAWGVF